MDDIVWAAHRRDEAQSLETLARMPGVPLELISEKVSQYASLPKPAAAAQDRERFVGTKVALIRRFITDRIDYISIAKRYLRTQDFDWVLRRCIGTEHGQGLIGGKAAGMVLAHAILSRAGDDLVEMPETVFVLTDAYEEFKLINGLPHLQDHKYKPIDEIRADYPAISGVFGNAEFPPRVADLLRIELDRLGEVPVIVRSSSMLEDSFGATFSGIYRSLFLLNQGPLEDRLQDLLGAIAEIFSGVFSPDAISYRRRHSLLDYDERMACMIQPVVGSRRGRYYFPAMAGVAFSRNDHLWNRRIRREDGMARLVVGLGTHAVDRVGDFARVVPLQAPTVRPEGTPEEIQSASQKQVDVIDLEGEGFLNVSISEALEAMRASGLADYISILEEDGRLRTPVSARVTAPAEQMCVTFDRLLQGGEFTKGLHRMLKALETAYGTPVDIEFAVDQDRLYLLQCRPLGAEVARVRKPIPTGISEPDRIFSANRYINDGGLEDIEYLVLIDPQDYGRLPTIERRQEVARVVGRINDALADRTFILMGPGRWGSQDIRLGIQISYADICNTSALVEIARRSAGYTPEPSFGTHFFQDLTEDGILYLPLYPEDETTVFNEAYFRDSPNALEKIVPGHADLAGIVRVVEIASASPGRSLTLLMDGELQQALCFLA